MMARRPADPTSLAAVSMRLAITRLALNRTQADMDKLMGSSSGGQSWQNYESGRRRITVDHALGLVRTCRLTLPWIYQGEMKDLPPDLYEKLLELLPTSNQPTTLKGRSRTASRTIKR